MKRKRSIIHVDLLTAFIRVSSPNLGQVIHAQLVVSTRKRKILMFPNEEI